jgi:hypothetical protein
MVGYEGSPSNGIVECVEFKCNESFNASLQGFQFRGYFESSDNYVSYNMAASSLFGFGSDIGSKIVYDRCHVIGNNTNGDTTTVPLLGDLIGFFGFGDEVTIKNSSVNKNLNVDGSVIGINMVTKGSIECCDVLYNKTCKGDIYGVFVDSSFQPNISEVKVSKSVAICNKTKADDKASVGFLFRSVESSDIVNNTSKFHKIGFQDTTIPSTNTWTKNYACKNTVNYDVDPIQVKVVVSKDCPRKKEGDKNISVVKP